MDMTEPVAAPPATRRLLAREPDWQFSLMLALEIVFLFVAIPALSAGGVDRSVVTLLQLVLAGTAIALLAKSVFSGWRWRPASGSPCCRACCPGCCRTPSPWAWRSRTTCW